MVRGREWGCGAGPPDYRVSLGISRYVMNGAGSTADAARHINTIERCIDKERETAQWTADHSRHLGITRRDRPTA